MGGIVDELIIDEGLKIQSDYPFKGNVDLKKLDDYFKNIVKKKSPFKN